MGIEQTYPAFTAFDDNGIPLAGGFVETYEADGTTPKATYQDYALTVPHLNPIELNARGEALIYLGAGATQFVVKDADGVLVDTFDNLYPASSSSNSVLLTGDQTIAGVKTHTSFPVTPSSAPTANYQVANKKYVDDADAALTSAKSTWVAGVVTNLKITRPSTTTLTVTCDGVRMTNGSGGYFDAAAVNITALDLSQSASRDVVDGIYAAVLQNNTWYHVFIISNGTLTKLWVDTTSTPHPLPTGYTYYKRVSMLRTDGSALFLSFKQLNSEFVYGVRQTELSSGNAGSYTSISLSYIPTGTAIGMFVANAVVNSGSTHSVVTYISNDGTNNYVSTGTYGIGETSVAFEIALITNLTLYYMVLDTTYGRANLYATGYYLEI